LHLGIYVSDLAARSIEKDFLILLLGRVIPAHTVSKASSCVLEIDVATAWTEMELNGGWSNEVRVELLMGLHG
jgi:hypothetical protein